MSYDQQNHRSQHGSTSSDHGAGYNTFDEAGGADQCLEFSEAEWHAYMRERGGNAVNQNYATAYYSSQESDYYASHYGQQNDHFVHDNDQNTYSCDEEVAQHLSYSNLATSDAFLHYHQQYLENETDQHGDYYSRSASQYYYGDAAASVEPLDYSQSQGCQRRDSAKAWGAQRANTTPYDFKSPDEDSLPTQLTAPNCKQQPKAVAEAIVTSPLKYLDATHVRWFVFNPEKKEWDPFNGHDSLKIEHQFRRLYNIDRPSSIITEMKSGGGRANIQQDETTTIPVMEGLYEVDIVALKCFPIYWAAEPVDVTRGDWFTEGNWQPVEMQVALEVESYHRQIFCNIDLHRETVNDNVVFSRSFDRFRIDWYSHTNVEMHYETYASKFGRAVKDKFGLRSKGTQLFRGYHKASNDSDHPPTFSHVIFVIHGIGQNIETGRIVKCCSNLQQTMALEKKKLLPKLEAMEGRCLLLPCEWRSSLSLDRGMVEKCTPAQMRTVRSYLNDSVLDLMYYNSPKFRGEIVEKVVYQLNGLHAKFCRRNPDFVKKNGKFSVIAHSLGSIIMYDILSEHTIAIQSQQQLATELATHQHSEHVSFCDIFGDLQTTCRTLNNLTMSMKHSACMSAKLHLSFDIDKLFFIGSPLAVFLALRGFDEADKRLFDKYMGRLFNVYLAADPIAYRVEPILGCEYVQYESVEINNKSAAANSEGKPESTDSGYDAVAAATAIPASITTEAKSIPATGAGSKQDAASVNSSSLKLSLNSFFEWGRKNLDSTEASKDVLVKTPSPAAEIPQKPKLKSDQAPASLPRYDYILLDTSTNQYTKLLSVIFAHTGYWNNKDFAHFLVQKLFESEIAKQCGSLCSKGSSGDLK